MSDVTIPAETAKRIAGVLRMHADTVPTGSAAATQWGALADLLDTPPTSLLNAVADAITSRAGYGDKDDPWNKKLAATVLSIVWWHVEAMPDVIRVTDEDEMVRALVRADVLRLLGAGDE